ncbi:hypothetical protein FSP39_002072 [Pinctada imbricata]|uniref:THD domain-containing protein n=1 Tax=Pinctada imbricata TaxID=66713 RepID=A0AA88XYG4_PINIB|nr:hypothetical protein FSP39_002072 [Pinctada imbricata]
MSKEGESKKREIMVSLKGGMPRREMRSKRGSILPKGGELTGEWVEFVQIERFKLKYLKATECHNMSVKVKKLLKKGGEGEDKQVDMQKTINNIPSTSSINVLITSPSGKTRRQCYGRTQSESSDTSGPSTHRSISESSDVELVDTNYHKNSSCMSQNRIFVAVIATFGTLIIFLVTLIAFLWVNLDDVKSRLSDEISARQNEANRFCLPCADLKLGPFPEDNVKLASLTRRVNHGIEECCSTNPEQTSLIFDLVFEKRKKIQCTNELIQQHQGATHGCNVTGSGAHTPSSDHAKHVVSAHLLAGAQQKQGHNEPGPAAVRNWSVIDPIAHVNGLTVMNDRIKVNTSGLYFVYSQVYFVSYPHSQTNSSSSSHALYHFVYRFNVIYANGGEELLLKGVRTKCWSRIKDFDDYTSYTGAVLHLNANDEIYVKVSNVSSISVDSKATFLGLFKIS